MTPVVALLIVVLALHDGGAPLEARSITGIVAWWAVLLGAAFGLLPRARLPREALVALGLLAAFAALALLSGLWAASAERAVLEGGRVLVYLALAVLVVALSRPGDAARWSDGLAAGLVVVAALALAQRLFGDLLPEDEAARVLENSSTRLSWPVGYWNGLGILVGLAVPLLLRLATAPGAVALRAAAVAPFPIIAAAIYLTSSRGGVVAALAGAAVFLALTARRLAGLWALLVAAATSAAAVAVLSARDVLADGPFDSAAAESQGGEAALLSAGLCVLAAVVHALLARVAPPRLAVPRGVAVALAAGAAVVVVAGVAAADPGRRIDEFKAPPPDVGAGAFATQDHLTGGGGSGRWQFWEAAVDQFADHPLAGDGAGSYEAYWARHGELDWFVRNAHSLWFETLGTLGLLGGLLLAGVFATALVSGARRLRDRDDGERTTVAALLAVLVAFMAGASLDWIWQLPVVGAAGIVALALLAGPATARRGGSSPRALAPHGGPALGAGSVPPAEGGRFAPRAAAVVGAWLALVALVLPFLAAEEIEASRDAASRGDQGEAADRAGSARALVPWAASPRLQQALLLEEAGDLRGARQRIGEAIERDETDWRLHLVAARLATKARDVPAARAALAEARRLNPRSPALRQATGG